MNLDKASAAQSRAPLAPPEWTMVVERDLSQFTADVRLANRVMCRVSVVREDGDEDAARAALADKARDWIHDYLVRSRSSA
jgi:hypothetical protein